MPRVYAKQPDIMSHDDDEVEMALELIEMAKERAEQAEEALRHVGAPVEAQLAGVQRSVAQIVQNVANGDAPLIIDEVYVFMMNAHDLGKHP
jgi:predicted RNA-binding protein associated with RNAse of E/G family